MLEFDAFQRSETVKRILNATLPSGSTALDVGGYPGRLRAGMPQYQWFICDPLVDAPGDQVIGDAAALPFGNSTTDVSISLDVLEHIPAQNRDSFLHEICRVSKTGFILSFPHDDALVQQAETAIRIAYQEKYAGKKHPWLNEHHLYGLPNADAVITRCMKMGLHVQVLPTGSVSRWQMLQWFGLMMENHAEGIEAVKDIDRYYQEHIYQHDFYLPSYRTILVCWKDKCPVPIESLFQDGSKDQLSVDLELHEIIGKHCAKWFSSGCLAQNSSTELQNFTTPQINDYITRLETGLRLWEDTCALLNQRVIEELQWRDKVECHPAMRWYKRIIQLFRA